MEQMNFFILAGILIIIGLFLKNWHPPIAPQYRAGIILTVGAALGHFIVANWAYGFLMAGLVFYKDELVGEVDLVRGSFTKIKDKQQKEL